MIHDTQRKLLSYARENSLDGKTLRGIGEAVGETHPQNIKHHLEQLITKGFLQRDENGNINVVESDYSHIPEPDTELRSIPILGRASCGPARTIASQDVEGYLRVSPRLLPTGHNVFAVIAVGNSMNKAMIKNSSIDEGDYVIVDPDTAAESGDYVLSVIDGLANVKKFHRDEEQHQIVLYSQSTTEHAPIVIDPSEADYFLNGKVIRVIKPPKAFA
jgi:repressor LexA